MWSSIVGDEDVRGLEVPMHDVLLVSCGEAFRDLAAELDRLTRRKRTGFEVLGEIFSFKKLRHCIGNVV